MTKLESLETAAMLLYEDPRRRLAGEFSGALSSHVAELLQSYTQCFDTTYSSVRGSTYCDTHLPNDLDFDIGLLPVRGVDDWLTPLQEFVPTLGEALALDAQMYERLSELFGTTPDVVRTSLRNPVLKQRGNLVVLKFRLEERDRTMIEVGAGNDRWHRVLLRYNAGWDKQVNNLLPDKKRRVISHVCLMKFLAKCCNIYGGDGPGSRNYEQMVIKYADKTDQSPIEALMTEMLGVDDPRNIEVPFPIPNEIWAEEDIELRRNNVMRAFSPEAWSKFQCLARAVLN